MGAAVELTPQRAEVSWAALTAVVVARAYRAMILTWVAVAIVPTLFGPSSYVIRSGSMEPSISVGDVVTARAVQPDDRIAVGRVYVYDDPAESGRTLVHRVVERRDDGDFTTAGDANALTDHLPLPRENITARAFLLVPWVGLPVVWVSEGRWLFLGLWMGVTTLALVVASRRVGGGSPGAGSWLRRRLGDRSRRALPVAAVLLVALPLLHAARPSAADATFTDRTANGSNAWQAGHWEQPYVDAVLADSPSLFWLLDEASGPWANDQSESGHTGRYADVREYRQPGALPNNFGYAVRPGAQGRVVDDGSSTYAPGTFTLELWFRTTSSTGGRLIGFGSTQDATSSRSDRTIHMADDGRLVYGAWEDSSQKTLSSPRSYNDGQWHHLALVATERGNSGNQDSILYVDGDQVASGGTTKTQDYAGWWRVGYGAVPVGRTAPSSAGFDGLVDNVAIYPTALSGQRIRAHYGAR